VLSGNSVGTRMLFGPVEVWQGVRDGVEWAALGRPAHGTAGGGRPHTTTGRTRAAP